MADNDVGDTREEDNPTQSDDISKEFGSAANPEGQRRSHQIAREYHYEKKLICHTGEILTFSAREVCWHMTRGIVLEKVRMGKHYLLPQRSLLVRMWTE